MTNHRAKGLHILHGALNQFFGVARKRTTKPRPQYEVVGDDGRARPVERSGRTFRAVVAPGVTAPWASLKQARSEGYTVRLRRQP
jgi:hypothetical protein